MTLRQRITLQTGLAVLLTTILGITASIIILRQEFLSFVQEEDERLAEQVAPLIVRYHELGLTWDEIGLSLGTVSESSNQRSNQRSNMMGSMGMMRSMGKWMESQRSGMMNSTGMMNWAHINDHRIVITDSLGIVRIDSDRILLGDSLINESQSIGRDLIVDGNYGGSVFIGSMLDSDWNQSQTDLIRKLITGIALSSLFSLFMSALFIWFNLSKTLKPIADLTNAVNIGSTGNHEVRVQEAGPYELAVLTSGFNKMNESIMNTNKVKDDIFSNIAHELKTPLSLIRGNLEAIVDDVYDLSIENVKNILDETKQLSVIVDDMSFLSKMSSGIKFDMNDIIDINTMVTDIANGFSIIAEKSNVQLNIKSPLPLCSVQGNYSKLKQAVSNIISNSIFHGGEDGKIEISANIKTTNSKSQILKLHILDQGAGVDEDELELIFNRLYRADKSRSRSKGGHGLGLSISREIARIHGGNISARNHPDAGLEVVIELPVIK